MRVPLLYKKMTAVLHRSIEDNGSDLHEVESDISRTFRLSKIDIKEILKELSDKGEITVARDKHTISLPKGTGRR